MDKQTIYIGLGVLAVAGIAYYFLMKKKPETTSGAHGEEETSSLRRKDGERSGNDCWSASNNMWVDCKKK